MCKGSPPWPSRPGQRRAHGLRRSADLAGMQHDDALVANIPGIRYRRGAAPSRSKVCPACSRRRRRLASVGPRDARRQRRRAGFRSGRPRRCDPRKLRQIQTTRRLTAARAAPRMINPAVDDCGKARRRSGACAIGYRFGNGCTRRASDSRCCNRSRRILTAWWYWCVLGLPFFGRPLTPR